MPAYRNILVAVRPGSPDSHPLRSATAVAIRARARLRALRVAPAPRSPAGIEPTLQQGVPVHTAFGIPAIEIIREAESMGADFLVLGWELSSQMDLRHAGNTVEGTVRRARIPCLVVPRGREVFDRVLAAVDGGPDSRDVIAAARLVSQLFDASVRAVRVEPGVLAVVGAPTALHDVAAAVGDETLVCQGDPVSEILRVVREENVDLLVFGHHRGGSVSTHATSGVAARLLQRAPCAVLTVPI